VVSDGEGGGPLREDPKSEIIALLHDPFVQLADIRLKPFNSVLFSCNTFLDAPLYWRRITEGGLLVKGRGGQARCSGISQKHR
jgi:hypothetical protein